MKFKFLVITLLFALTPLLSFAQPVGGADPSDPGANPSDPGADPGGGSNNPQVTVVDINIPNPISVDTIPEFIEKVLDFILTIGLPILAMAIIYSGFLFVTAGGKDAQITNAKNALLFAVIGGFILLASWLIAEGVKDALSGLVTMI